MPREERLAAFVSWAAHKITGDEKGQAQIFLDRLFQAFDLPGALDVGGHTEFRIRKAGEDGGGTAFADYVWKPVVLIEMKKRGQNLQKHYRQAFDSPAAPSPARSGSASSAPRISMASTSTHLPWTSPRSP